MLSHNELDRIAKTITDAEVKTSGEIVVVLAKQSDEYRFIPVLWAAILVLLLPLIMVVNGGFNDIFGFDRVLELDSYLDNASSYKLFNIVYLGQLILFMLTFLLAQWRPLKMALVPKYIKIRRAKRLAREQFLIQETHSTDERTGVLLFISLGEHYAEVIADHGIYQKMDKAIWQGIMDRLIVKIKQDKMADALTAAIDEIGLLLEENFPKDPNGHVNQLPNHLILI